MLKYMAGTGLFDHVIISKKFFYSIQAAVFLIVLADILSDLTNPNPWVPWVDLLEVLFWVSVLTLEIKGKITPLYALGLLGFLMGMLLTVDLVTYLGGLDNARPFLFTMNYLGTVMLLSGSSLILGRSAGVITFILAEGILLWGYFVHRDENAPVAFMLLAVIIIIFSLVIAFFRRALQTLYSNLQKEKDAAQKAAQTIRDMEMQNRRKEKVAYMSSLAAGIAHEMKNPLNLIINFSESSEEMLAELDSRIRKPGEKMPPEEYRAVRTLLEELVLNQKEVISQGRQGESIIRSIQQQARKGTAPRRQEHLNLLAEEALEMAVRITQFRNWTPAPEAELRLDPRLPALRAARSEMLQVLLNLIINSLHSLKEKAASGSPGFKPALIISTGGAPGGQTVTVEDNGSGFPEDRAELLFEPFYTTKPPPEGSGLGLSICREIVHNHGGTLTARGSPGKGAVFTLFLPEQKVQETE